MFTVCPQSVYQALSPPLKGPGYEARVYRHRAQQGVSPLPPRDSVFSLEFTEIS